MRTHIVRQAVWLLIAVLFFGFATTAQEGPFAVCKAQTAPILDGQLSVDEWGETLYTLRPGDPQMFIESYGDEVEVPDDIQIYMMWDKEYLYLAVAVDSAHHYNRQSQPADAWNGNAVLLTLIGRNGQDRICSALGADGVSLLGEHNRHNTDPNNDRNQASQGQNAVQRVGTVTIHEIRLAWETLEYTSLADLQQGGQVAFSVAAHLADPKLGLYAGAVLYSVATDANGQPQFPVLTLSEQPANDAFDPNAATSTTVTTTQTHPTTVTYAQPSASSGRPSAELMRWVLLGLLGATVVTGTILLIVVIRRR